MMASGHPLCVIIMEHSILLPQLMAVVAISTWQPRIRPSLVRSGVAERCSRHWPFSFFDEDGRCYYTGNRWDFKSAWPAQCAIWMQELDFQKRCLVGERKTLAYGHAANAKYAEGPHLYKIGNHYLLLMGEGGSDYNHAVTALTAKSLWGPYILFCQSRIDTPPSWQGLPCAVSRTCRSGTDTDQRLVCCVSR